MTKLNNEQAQALAAIDSFLKSSEGNFFVLSGSAGTGKTFCIRELTNLTKGRFIFTAPTNNIIRFTKYSS